MTINQLKYTITVAKYSSMRAAATKLFISQPALSAAIADLEQEIGIEIFARTNKGIQITPEGTVFLNYAKKVVSQYAVLEERYISEEGHKEHFSVSTQHYSFAIRSFTNTVNEFGPMKTARSARPTATSWASSTNTPRVRWIRWTGCCTI